LKVDLSDIHKHFHEKDAIADAWLDHADEAMLKEANKPGVMKLKTKDCLHHLILTWLNSLNKHKKVTGQILLGKLEIGHLHVPIHAMLRINRTVQWLREASHLDSKYLNRALEESGLTSIFLLTVVYWLKDKSDHNEKTSQFLNNQLHKSDQFMKLVPDFTQLGQSIVSSITKLTNPSKVRKT